MSPVLYKVTFKLDERSTRGVPGLPTIHSSLPCVATAGDTVGVVVDKLNLYRGPHHQIMAVWDISGLAVPLTTSITGDCTFFVRA